LVELFSLVFSVEGLPTTLLLSSSSDGFITSVSFVRKITISQSLNVHFFPPFFFSNY
jgi:hypothetical protein